MKHSKRLSFNPIDDNFFFHFLTILIKKYIKYFIDNQNNHHHEFELVELERIN